MRIFSPKIGNEFIKAYVEKLNSMELMKEPKLYLNNNTKNKVATVLIKRVLLMAYEVEYDIRDSIAVYKNLNRHHRIAGGIALSILKEAIAKTEDTNYSFTNPFNGQQQLSLRLIQMGLHIKHPMYLSNTKTTFAKLYSARFVHLFGLEKALYITRKIKSKSDREILEGRINIVKNLIQKNENYGYPSKYLPELTKKNFHFGERRIIDCILSEASENMKALFPLNDYHYWYLEKPFSCTW